MNDPATTKREDISSALTKETNVSEIMDEDELLNQLGLNDPDDTSFKRSVTSESDISHTTNNYLTGDLGSRTFEQLKEGLDFFKQIPLMPLFDTEGLAEMSKTYYFYFEIYLYLLKLTLAILIFGNVEVSIMLWVMDKYNLLDSEKYWILAWAPIHLMNILIIFWIHRKSENKIMKDPKLSNLAWTEANFSLMIDNIPNGTFEHDLKETLETILKHAGEKTGVRYIIFLQDCNKYSKIRNIVRKMEEKLNKSKIKSLEKKKRIITKKAELEKQMSMYEQRAMNKDYFLNKAIVVFNKVNSRFIIHKKLNEISKTTNLSDRGRLYSNQVFNHCNLKASYITEPRDILYEKMHHTNRELLKRKAISIAIIALMVIIGLTVMYYIRVRQFCIMAIRDPSLADNDLPCNELMFLTGAEIWMDIQMYCGGIVNVAIAVLMEGRYKALSRYRIYKTHTSAETSFIYYIIIITFFNYVILIIMPLFILGLKWMQNVIFEVGITLILQRIAAKLWRVDWKKRRIREKIEANPQSHGYNEDQIYDAYHAKCFNFLEGVGDMVGLSFITFGFFLYDSFDLIPCIFVGLLIFLIIDKYVIIKYTTPFNLRTLEFGLMLLKPFFLDNTIYMFVLAVGCIKVFIISGSKFDGITSLMSLALIGVLVFFAGSIIYFFFGSKDLKKMADEKYESSQKGVMYDDVSMVFETTYLEQYPYGGLISF